MRINNDQLAIKNIPLNPPSKGAIHWPEAPKGEITIFMVPTWWEKILIKSEKILKKLNIITPF